MERNKRTKTDNYNIVNLIHEIDFMKYVSNLFLSPEEERRIYINRYSEFHIDNLILLTELLELLKNDDKMLNIIGLKSYDIVFVIITIKYRIIPNYTYHKGLSR